MKKKYLKPDLELITFISKEMIADNLEGEMGGSDLPEGWD